MAKLFEIIFQSEQLRIRIRFTTNWVTFTLKKFGWKIHPRELMCIFTLSLKKTGISDSSASSIYERQCEDSRKSFSKSVATLTQFHFTREAGTVQ